MADYSISLGAFISPSGIQRIRTQIKALENNPIQLKVDSSLVDSRIKGIKQELNSLGGKGGLKFDTSALEASLDRVATDINEIRLAFGTLDSKSGMGNLLTSIHQISTALDNASKQFVELNSQLNTLAGKNFSVNIGLNMGGGNAVSRNAAYGSMVRGETIPQLQQQVTALESYLQRYYKVADGFNAVQRLIQGTGIVTGANHPMTLLPQMADGGNLSKQMTAYKQYIALIKEAASLRGIDLTSVTSGFSKSANELVTDAQKVQTGAAEMESSFEKLKQIFGGGNHFNIEGISTQLDSIVADLNEIKIAIQSLSQNASLSELTTSVNNLSSSLEKLMGNATQAKNVLNNGLNASGTSAGTERAIQEQERLAQATTQTANVVSQSGQKVQQAFNQMASASNLDPINLRDDISETDEMAAAVTRLKQVMSGIGNLQTGQLGTAKSVQELQVLEMQLESLSAEWNETVAEINSKGGLGLPQMQQLRGQMEATARTIEQLKAQLMSGITGNVGGYETGLIKLETRLNQLKSATPELRMQLENLKQVLISLRSADSFDDMLSINRQYLLSVEQITSAITQLEAVEKRQEASVALEQMKEQSLMRLHSLYEQGSVAAKKFGGEVQALDAKIRSCGTKSGFQQINKEISILGSKIKQVGAETQTFGSRLKSQLSQYSVYFSGYMMFMYIIQGLRSMFEQVKAIDSAMTELKKVTDETDASYNRFLTNASSRAKEIGTTISGLVDSTADFARLGYSFEDAQGLAEVANIYAVVGDEIEGVDQATESLISTMAAFKDSAGEMSNTDFATSIIDKFNEIGKLIA